MTGDSTTTGLTLYEEYDREQVHDIFAPSTTFIPQAGTWGIQGTIPIPGRPGDYVFFVTYGQQQGDQVFDEGVTEDGVLTWQYQLRQESQDHRIRDFIAHDDLKHSIYLFLRTKERIKYTYLGKLKYLSHDYERQQPVYFQWQILDWALPVHVAQRMELALQPAAAQQLELALAPINQLVLTPPPAPVPRGGSPTVAFRARKAPDYAAQDAKNRELGSAGELLVLEHERQTLLAQGRGDLAAKVRHVSAIEGEGPGYDIESFTADGTAKYIDVKTTSGSAATGFFLTPREVQFSQDRAENYYLYRVYEYDHSCNSAKVYILRGDLRAGLELAPTAYRAMLLSSG